MNEFLSLPRVPGSYFSSCLPLRASLGSLASTKTVSNSPTDFRQKKVNKKMTGMLRTIFELILQSRNRQGDSTQPEMENRDGILRIFNSLKTNCSFFLPILFHLSQILLQGDSIFSLYKVIFMVCF